MSLYPETVPVFTKMLRNLSELLNLAKADADDRGYALDNLLTSRLAPNMWELSRQVQAACDTAKLTVARLARADAPKHEDGPASIDELQTRIAEVISFIEGLPEASFAGSEARDLAPSFLKGGTVQSVEYVRGFALPNFYFHITTVYALLRINGVKVSKTNFIGGMEVKPPPSV